ncbi:hypothetical protein IV203_025489 [Nitzschia inconspicua]|uniref:C2H2-type domain-containing protein n=1 Tax=Nitzschia inconspicua TaxID=303405 RepID=A0A9K3PWX1_9STRA|nr:hypothetical protein IV203_028269 [Nitzschia inconspicua]KAG7362605.1 hypothetical protein IV203_025489 [Nitzschia inconspicua]
MSSAQAFYGRRKKAAVSSPIPRQRSPETPPDQPSSSGYSDCFYKNLDDEEDDSVIKQQQEGVDTQNPNSSLTVENTSTDKGETPSNAESLKMSLSEHLTVCAANRPSSSDSSYASCVSNAEQVPFQPMEDDLPEDDLLDRKPAALPRRFSTDSDDDDDDVMPRKRPAVKTLGHGVARITRKKSKGTKESLLAKNTCKLCIQVFGNDDRFLEHWKQNHYFIELPKAKSRGLRYKEKFDELIEGKLDRAWDSTLSDPHFGNQAEGGTSKPSKRELIEAMKKTRPCMAC